jgi:hypothetical protein
MQCVSGWKRLAAAVLARAVRDARRSNRHSAEARAWLARDPLAGDLLNYVGFDQEQARQWVTSLEQPMR